MAGLTDRGGRTAAMVGDDGGAPRADSLPPAARAVLTDTDRSALPHACTGLHGVPDTPDVLRGLLDDDPARRVRAAADLCTLVLHQDTLQHATAPAARYVAAVLADPRTRARANSNGG
ncbi:hypothetical protein ACFQ1I_01545 [Kitasatospora arboriphila]